MCIRDRQKSARSESGRAVSSLHKFAEFGKSIMSLHPSFVLKLVLLVLRKKKKREKERNYMPNGIQEWEKKPPSGF